MVVRLFRSACLAVLSLALLPAAASAQSASLPSFASRTGYALPQAGAYFDSSQGGVGLMVDVGLDGTVFGALAIYDADGEPTFYTVQGPIERGSLPAASTAIGVLHSPLYRSRDGQCLGCSWRAPVTEVETRFGEAEVLFTEGRRLELRVGGSIWRMQRMEIDYSVDQLLPDAWLLALEERRADGSVLSVQSRVRIAPIDAASVRVEGPASCGGSPPAGTALYELTCESDCAAFDTWAPRASQRVLAWRNADSATFELAHVQPSADGFVAPAGSDRRTLDVDSFVLSGRPNPAQCGGALVRSTLRLYRDPIESPTTLVLPREALPVGAVRAADAYLATTGFYYDPTRAGTGILMDRGARGSVFAAWFGYGPTGRPTFRVLQGAVAAVRWRFESGLFPPLFIDDGIGVYAPFVKSAGGAQIGQPWRPNVVALDAASGNAALLTPVGWHTELSLYAGGTVQRQSRLELDRTGPDFMLDRWLLVSDNRFVYGDGREFPTDGLIGTETRAVVEIEALPPGPLGMPGAGFPLLPLGTDRAYRLRCVEHCAGFAALTALNAQFRPPQPGMEAIMVLPARQNTIDGSGSGVDLLSSSYPVATLWLAAPCGSGWCRDPFAANWELASLNRDQLQGAGTAQSCSYVLCPYVQQRGQLRLLRFPRDLH